MARVRLGEILINHGLITQKQLQEAIDAQKTQKGRIGEILIKQGVIKEEDLAAALGTQLMIPYASHISGLLKPKRDQFLDKLVPHEFALKSLVLPLSRNENSLTCPVFDPLDFVLLYILKIMTNC